MSDSTTPKRRIPDAFVLGALVAVAIAVLLAGWFGSATRPLGFPLDDAWIHMVYGRNLATHGALAYNDVATTGATSPLWAGLVAIAHLLGGGDVDRTVVVVYLLGVAFFLTSVAFTWRVTCAITANRVVGAAAAVLVATSGPFAMSSFSGMEVTLTAMLLLVAVDACVGHRWMQAGFWLACAALARPEAAIVSLACFIATASSKDLRGSLRAKALVRLTVPSAVVGGLVVIHALYATGHPLPSTFYMKQEASVTELPTRLHIVLRGLLGDVPPFATGLAYVALIGLLIPLGSKGSSARGLLPAGAGVLFVVANAVLIRPHANVFYHLRYILPALPLLVVAAVVGANRLGVAVATRYPRFKSVPVVLLVVVGLLEALPTVRRHGARLHNDTRNIEEVQRSLGMWIAAHTRPGTWIATGDAGAVRYFGNRPTIDVMGLNTPELYWQPGWGAAHPVAAFVMLPCWFAPRDPRLVHVAAGVQTARYTVTTAECMREQLVVTCAGEQPVELAFSGVKQFTLTCQPGRLFAAP